MANPIFPSDLADQQDSKFYNRSNEDQALKTPIEGGYVVSRPRHTRTARITFTTGFTSMTDAQRIELENFYDSQRGPSNVFDWIDPATGTTYTVRFTDKLDFKYTGMGPTKLWDVTFSLEQV